MAAELFLLPFRPALDANAIPVVGAQLFFYATGTSTPQAVFADEALSISLGAIVEANSAGVWPTIYLDNTKIYRAVLKDNLGEILAEADPYVASVVDNLAPEIAQNAADAIAAASIISLINGGYFETQFNPPPIDAAEGQTYLATEDGRAALLLNVAGTGVIVFELSTLPSILAALSLASGSNSVGFSNAISAIAGTVGASLKSRGVVVTDAPFNADATETANSYPAVMAAIAASNHIQIPAGRFKLNTRPIWTKSVNWDIDPAAVFTGAGSGEGKFPYMNTNAAQMAVGPYVYSYSYQKSTNVNGGTGAFNIEVVQPDDYGAGQQVALFVGNRSNAPNAGANTWSINTVTGVLDNATGTHQGIEVDIDTNSTVATTKGIAITGGGTANADVAVEIDRASTPWDIGISISQALNGMFVNGKAAGTGITINGPVVQAVGIGGTALTAIQLDSGKDVILLQRVTDTAPSGYFLRCVNQANNSNLFLVDVAGNVQFAGTFKTAIYPEFADNAAATAGGLTPGQHYRTGDLTKQVH